MKKIRIMLTAMIVFGTVGGVLAVKERRDVGRCTRSTVNGVCPTNAKCPNGALLRIDDSAGAVKCYTTTTNTARCATDNPSCSETAKFGPN